MLPAASTPTVTSWRLTGYSRRRGGSSAVRGDEADLMLFDVDCDLLVLDLNLPGMDGMEVLQRLRSYDK